MKNLFKKFAKKQIKTTIQKLDKNQLEKIAGGVETTASDSTPNSSLRHIGNWEQATSK